MLARNAGRDALALPVRRGGSLQEIDGPFFDILMTKEKLGKKKKKIANMRIIHTSDWHLGAKLHEQDRAEDQAAFLSDLRALMQSHGADVLLISGDVFVSDINADAIILIRLKDGADKAGVIASLETYLESVKSNTQSYSPENYAKTAQSEVSEASDGTIYLIITENYSSAVSKL